MLHIPATNTIAENKLIYTIIRFNGTLCKFLNHKLTMLRIARLIS